MTDLRIPDYRPARRTWLRQTVLKGLRDAVIAVAMMVVTGIGWIVLIGIVAVALALLGMALDPLVSDGVVSGGAATPSEPTTVGPGISSDYWGAGCDPGGDYAC